MPGFQADSVRTLGQFWCLSHSDTVTYLYVLDKFQTLCGSALQSHASSRHSGFQHVIYKYL